jgi:hypothetical protein
MPEANHVIGAGDDENAPEGANVERSGHVWGNPSIVSEQNEQVAKMYPGTIREENGGREKSLTGKVVEPMDRT